LVGVAVLLVVPALLVPSASGGTAATRDLLPDLVTWRPAEIFLETTDRWRRFVRFSNEVVNVGAGPLELRPRADDCNGNGNRRDDRTSYQRIYRDADGNGRFTRGVDRGFRTRRAGCTLFHRAHNHWHFEALAEYSLHALGGAGPGALPVVAQKTSSCVLDTKRQLPKAPGAPRTKYYGGCRRDSVGGISIGWGDGYGARVSGQALEVTDLPDGVYCLVSRADPDDRIRESNERNNTRTTRIVLRGRTLRWQPYRPCSPPNPERAGRRASPFGIREPCAGHGCVARAVRVASQRSR
jgi:hypothetical protein